MPYTSTGLSTNATQCSPLTVHCERMVETMIKTRCDGNAYLSHNGLVDVLQGAQNTHSLWRKRSWQHRTNTRRFAQAYSSPFSVISLDFNKHPTEHLPEILITLWTYPVLIIWCYIAFMDVALRLEELVPTELTVLMVAIRRALVLPEDQCYALEILLLTLQSPIIHRLLPSATPQAPYRQVRRDSPSH